MATRPSHSEDAVQSARTQKDERAMAIAGTLHIQAPLDIGANRIAPAAGASIRAKRQVLDSLR